MDIGAVKVTQKDIERVLAKAAPAQAAGFTGDACQIYSQARPLIEVAIGILNAIYPKAAVALAAVVAIMDKLCGQPSSSK